MCIRDRIVDNKLVYNPGANYQFLSPSESAEVIVRYTIIDDHGVPSEAELTLSINGQRDAMVMHVADLVTDEDQAVAWPLQLHSIDIRGEEVTQLTVHGLPVGTQLSDNEGHIAIISSHDPTVDIQHWKLASLQFTPPPAFSGQIIAEVQLSTTNSSQVDHCLLYTSRCV